MLRQRNSSILKLFDLDCAYEESVRRVELIWQEKSLLYIMTLLRKALESAETKNTFKEIEKIVCVQQYMTYFNGKITETAA